MLDTLSLAAENRRGKKERKKERRKKKKPHDENIMGCLFHRAAINSGPSVCIALFLQQIASANDDNVTYDARI